jgi:hypothetical protein
MIVPSIDPEEKPVAMSRRRTVPWEGASEISGTV